MRRLAFTVLLLTGCTSDNPLYSPSSGPDLARSTNDLAGQQTTTDLSSADLTELALCMDGARSCNAQKTESAVCANGALSPDRRCPMTSTCADGYCGLPMGGGNNSGRTCSLVGDTIPNESACFGGASAPLPSCQPFVKAGQQVVWQCAPPIGDGAVGTACTTGMNCRTGFCGSNGTCFRACNLVTDCPTSGGKWDCVPVKISVEGVEVSAGSCIPG